MQQTPSEKRLWRLQIFIIVLAYALPVLAIFSDVLLLPGAYTALEVLRASLTWLRIVVFGSVAVFFLFLAGNQFIIISLKREGRILMTEGWRNLQIFSCIFLAMFIFFIPLREKFPLMLAAQKDIAAIESGELFVGAFDVNTRRWDSRFRAEESLRLRGLGLHRGLYGAWGPSADRRPTWIQFPPALRPSVLNEIAPIEIYEQRGVRWFEVTITPNLRIVVDAVPVSGS